MKKTYFAPELESYKLTAATMLALSKTDEEATEEFNPSGNLSKGFGGSIWEDDTEE